MYPLASSADHAVPFLLIFLLLISAAAAAATAILEPSADQDQKRRDLVELFRKYLRIRTTHPNPDYATAAAFLTAEARSVGLLTQTLEFVPGKPILLFTWPGADPLLPSILLNSHMDSVPVEEDKWIHPPLAAHLDPADGRIFARGAQDDKCLAIQYLEALRTLKADSTFTPLRSIHVTLVPDEEIGGRDGAAMFTASEVFRQLNVGFVLDEGQASPTGEFRVFYADRAPWRLIVKARGQPGHGARMYDNTAIENLMELVEAVTYYRNSQFDLVKAGLKAASEVISLNPVYFKAGTHSPTGFVMNMQPSEAEVGFDVRIPPTENPDIIRRRIQEEWATISMNLTFKLIELGPLTDHAGRPLMTATNESNPWWAVFKQAISDSGGKLAEPEILSSTTDARFMRQMGIPSLGFSPMANTPILLHEHNEFLQDAVFLKGIEVYRHVIRSLSTFMESSV
ncbi:unnamed protein product [Spirodela intermedia]|uniref:N-acyl-aliphatic-L-amino acid amidohydrolase n=1 Tax=Spirodela intermedia TaxID=51605 RepID=A0A7I8KUT4_SPIIN|nr:unnamed protein product [Spirodela intermedia]